MTELSGFQSSFGLISLRQMADHTRIPPSKKGYAGSARTLLHRDEEKPCDYKSSLRSTFVNPEVHSDFFPPEGPAVMGRRERARLEEFREIAEAEAKERDDEKSRQKAVGSYHPASHDAQRHHGEDTYRQQKVSGKFLRSNKFINEMGKPRTDVECAQAPPDMSYLEAPAITKYSWNSDGSGKLKTNFKHTEEPLDYFPSDIWGHGKRGSMPEARGTGDGKGFKYYVSSRKHLLISGPGNPMHGPREEYGALCLKHGKPVKDVVEWTVELKPGERVSERTGGELGYLGSTTRVI